MALIAPGPVLALGPGSVSGLGKNDAGGLELFVLDPGELVSVNPLGVLVAVRVVRAAVAFPVGIVGPLAVRVFVINTGLFSPSFALFVDSVHPRVGIGVLVVVAVVSGRGVAILRGERLATVRVVIVDSVMKLQGRVSTRNQGAQFAGWYPPQCGSTRRPTRSRMTRRRPSCVPAWLRGYEVAIHERNPFVFRRVAGDA